MPKQRPSNDLAILVSNIPEYEDWTLKTTSTIATLWSNYGSIDRVTLRSPNNGEKDQSIIIKTVSPPKTDHNRADEGHLRKLLSYEVERWFYHNLAGRLPAGAARVARVYSAKEHDVKAAPIRLVMEDLSVEYSVPAGDTLDVDETKAVLAWLANFHGTFWGVQNEGDIRPRLVPPPLQYAGGNREGVWQQGSYWYLDTRRSELADIDRRQTWLLELAEKARNSMKTEAKAFGTLLHGDVKGANIFFAPRSQDDPPRCALYDFQYVGIGLVTRDLAKYLGTTVRANLLRRIEDEKDLLRFYHSELVRVIHSRKDVSPEVASFLEREGGYTFEKFWEHWELAIVDWHRFMSGWGFWGNEAWVEQRARQIAANWEKDPSHLS
ncbi:hypothetical protein AAF712_003022 [Marasmius tenuissimus]|uniref:CHK kinase-like domain-containing protein n=1 Tax=Marasmius tenuissimus TaxID=585030 RepID=A0ABR3A9R6_9AGAR